VKKYAVEVTRSALSDLKQISDFYLSHGEQKTVSYLITLIENTIEQLKTIPERGGEVIILVGKTRRPYQQYRADPFRLIYRVEKICVCCDGIASATKYSKGIAQPFT
jgi:mRNA-degrading endonuclease RelE of RelBE toxin-antitoxin system